MSQADKAAKYAASLEVTIIDGFYNVVDLASYDVYGIIGAMPNYKDWVDMNTFVFLVKMLANKTAYKAGDLSEDNYDDFLCDFGDGIGEPDEYLIRKCE